MQPSIPEYLLMASGSSAELRIDVSTDLLQRLDAVMQSRGLKARADYVVPLLEQALAKEVHAATLLLRMCRINPLLDGRAVE